MVFFLIFWKKVLTLNEANYEIHLFLKTDESQLPSCACTIQLSNGYLDLRQDRWLG